MLPHVQASAQKYLVLLDFGPWKERALFAVSPVVLRSSGQRARLFPWAKVIKAVFLGVPD
jgi:hypothetical protein